MKRFKFLAFALTGASLQSCLQISSPFSQSELLTNLASDEKVVVGITHVELHPDSDANSLFWQHTYRVIDSLENQQGYLGHRVRRDLGGASGWTMTVWEDEAALISFKQSNVHTTAIANGLPAVANARFLRLTLNKSELPLPWNELEKKMDQQGRKLY